MNIKTAYALMATTAILALSSLSSCKEGKYWDEPGDPGQVVGFAKPAATVTVDADAKAPETYDVTISRSKTVGDLTVDVTLTSDNGDVFTGEKTVTFKDGEPRAVYTIHIGDIMPGVQYAVKLSVPEQKGSLTHVDPNNLTFTLNLSQNLKWTDAGTATVTSLNWVENVTGEVKVEEGNWPVAGQRLFRLIDVYEVLEPDVAEPGADIRFLTDNDGRAIDMFTAWSYMGENSDGEYYFFGCPAEYGGSFTNEGNNYVMTGIVGTSDSLTGEVEPGWYETLTFTWACPTR